MRQKTCTKVPKIVPNDNKNNEEKNITKHLRLIQHDKRRSKGQKSSLNLNKPCVEYDKFMNADNIRKKFKI